VADLLLEKGDKENAATYYQGILDGAVGDYIACGALIGLGKIGDPSSLPVFGEKLSDESPSVRGVASKIVTEWPGSDVDELLAKRFKDAGGDEQAALLKVLVQRNAKGVDDLLVKSLSSDNPVVRITSVQILGERGGKDLEGAFLEASGDADLGVAKAAKMSYLSLADRVLADGDADRALEMYHEALSFTSDADAIRKALSGVAGLGKAESVEKVRALLEQPPLAVDAARAYLQLGKALGDSGNVDRRKEMVLEVIHHPNSGEVRNAALRDLKDLGEDTSVFAKRQGFITSWWVIGTFPNEKNEAFGKAFFPEKEVDLERGGEFEGEKLAWKKAETHEIPAKISLSQYFTENQFVTSYAYAEINAPEDMPILFLAGTNDGCEFWVNGEKLFETDDERGCEVDGDRLETTLKKGKNQVLLKVLQAGGGWEFCVRLARPDGTPIDLTQVKILQE
jgi:HEAT repeat protein